MKKIFIILMLTSVFAYLSACGKLQDDKSKQYIESSLQDSNETEQVNEPNEKNNIQKLSVYKGLWTKDGITKKEILQNGGAFIELTIESGDSLSGIYYCIQPSTQRIASVSFEGLNSNNSYSYAFSDDGFGNSGNLFLSLLNDSVEVMVEIKELANDNTSGWQLYSEVLVQPNQSPY